MTNPQNTPTTFLEVVDHETRDSVLRLNQKLKGLQAEIRAKLETLEEMNAPDAVTQKKNLSTLIAEVDKALLGISNLTHMVVTPEMTNSEFLQTNHNELEKFRDLVAEKAREITKLKEAF